ncbi:hypothetical protein [Azonexus sp.]|uniref:hypothetical protein n=1 Tax=Azonexus sp. TaxID=1872668 RepID=UPI0035B2CE7B
MRLFAGLASWEKRTSARPGYLCLATYGLIERMIGWSKNMGGAGLTAALPSSAAVRVTGAFVGSLCLHILLISLLEFSSGRVSYPVYYDRSALIAVLQVGLAKVAEQDGLTGEGEDGAASGKEVSRDPVAAARLGAASDKLGLPAGGQIYSPLDGLSKRPRLLRDPDFSQLEFVGLPASGRLGLKLWIGTSGLVEKVAIDPSDFPLEVLRSVEMAFKAARYSPAELNGVPIGVVLRIEVNFDAQMLVPGE